MYNIFKNIILLLIISITYSANADNVKTDDQDKNSPKKKTIFFHIGTGKTGTTTLQHFLYENRAVLEEKYDLFYPIINKHKSRIRVNGSFYLYPNLYNDFFTSIEKTNSDNILISEENLFEMHDMRIFQHEKLKQYNVKIIISIRSPVEYLSSMYAEMTKPKSIIANIKSLSFSTGAFDEYIKLDIYRKNLNMIFELSKLFGQDNIIIKPYEQERLSKTPLIEDFMSIFDMPITEDFIITKNQNPSLNRKYCDILAFLIKHQWSLQQQGMIIDKLDEIASKIGGDDRKVIDTIENVQIKEICDHYSDIMQRISTEFYNGKPLFQKDCYSYMKKEDANYIPLSESDKKTILEFIEAAKTEEEKSMNK